MPGPVRRPAKQQLVGQANEPIFSPEPAEGPLLEFRIASRVAAIPQGVVQQPELGRGKQPDDERVAACAGIARTKTARGVSQLDRRHLASEDDQERFGDELGRVGHDIHESGDEYRATSTETE
jgi:hypothetical protein